MKAQKVVARLRELGVSLEMEDLPAVDSIHITEEIMSPLAAKMIRQMQPETVTLPLAQMTAEDVTVLLGFPNLTSICAHGLPFATQLLATGLPFPGLSSIAMSNTALCNDDVAFLRGRDTIQSLHFVATKLTDDAFNTFGTLASLEILNVRETRLSDAGLMHLTNLRSLFTIDARGTLVTRMGASKFRQSVAKWLPDLEVLI